MEALDEPLNLINFFWQSPMAIMDLSELIDQ